MWWGLSSNVTMCLIQICLPVKSDRKPSTWYALKITLCIHCTLKVDKKLQKSVNLLFGIYVITCQAKCKPSTQNPALKFSGLTSNSSNTSVEVPILCPKSNMNIHHAKVSSSQGLHMEKIKCIYLNNTLEKWANVWNCKPIHVWINKLPSLKRLQQNYYA